MIQVIIILVPARGCVSEAVVPYLDDLYFKSCSRALGVCIWEPKWVGIRHYKMCSLCRCHPTLAMKAFSFWGCPVRLFVHLFVQSDSYHDISWMAWTILIKLAGNIHQPLLMTWLDFRVQRSRSQQAEVCRGLGIHVDVWLSKSIF